MAALPAVLAALRLPEPSARLAQAGPVRRGADGRREADAGRQHHPREEGAAAGGHHAGGPRLLLLLGRLGCPPLAGAARRATAARLLLLGQLLRLHLLPRLNLTFRAEVAVPARLAVPAPLGLPEPCTRAALARAVFGGSYTWHEWHRVLPALLLFTGLLAGGGRWGVTAQPAPVSLGRGHLRDLLLLCLDRRGTAAARSRRPRALLQPRRRQPRRRRDGRGGTCLLSLLDYSMRVFIAAHRDQFVLLPYLDLALWAEVAMPACLAILAAAGLPVPRARSALSYAMLR
mmetsp:Transcript_115139/g.326196  ORF Transcript_115139/g.326196 Transcript_115139/m.326196 type:complete len:288 (+) Transcript_115139:1085-1948(+)